MKNKRTRLVLGAVAGVLVVVLVVVFIATDGKPGQLFVNANLETDSATTEQTAQQPVVQSSAGGAGIRTSVEFEMPSLMNSDFIFRGTTLSVENPERIVELVDREPFGVSGTYTYYETLATIRVDAVYAGDAFSVGDTVVLYCQGGSDKGSDTQFSNFYPDGFIIAPGQEDVFFSMIFPEWLRPRLGFETGQIDLRLYDNLFRMFPVKDGLISADDVWADEVAPSVQVTPQEEADLSIGTLTLQSAQTYGRAFYTEQDFIA
ncbi:MAG: hypothetical protein LBU48_01085, partial [Coriobacteriales bacterium]|nr:hypothetical protein [Coriobacteriales bacterium]